MVTTSTHNTIAPPTNTSNSTTSNSCPPAAATRALVLAVVAALAGTVWHILSYGGPPTDHACLPPGSPHPFTALLSSLDAYIAVYNRDTDPSDPHLRGRFASTPQRPEPDLYGSIDMCLVLYISGQLEHHTSAASRQNWAAFIQAHQDPTSGLFLERPPASHSPAHATAYATSALRLLGAAPLHPFHWASALYGCDRDTPATRSSGATRMRTETTNPNLAAWLDAEVGWTQIWTGSHALGMPAAVAMAPALAPSINATAFAGDLLDTLDALADPGTGLWKRGPTDALIRWATAIDVGGAAHFWWLYDCLNRAPPHPIRAIASILGLQRASGIWGAPALLGAFPHCLDFDAVHGLALAWRSLPEAGEGAEMASRAALAQRILAAIECFLCAAELHLNSPNGLVRADSPYLHSAHKLPGAMAAVAEALALRAELLGHRKHHPPTPWRRIMDAVCWI